MKTSITFMDCKVVCNYHTTLILYYGDVPIRFERKKRYDNEGI